MNATARVGSWWHRPENQGRINTQIAAQRFISELIEGRRIHRGQKMLLDELSKHIDAKGTTQKTIAFLASRCGVQDRTIQRWLRGLCPSKAKDPEGWANRVLNRRFLHAAPEPGKKSDNVPSWFTIEIPARFFERPKGGPRRIGPAPQAPPAAKPPARPPSIHVSPGGGEIVTQAVILGSGSVVISDPLHPCTNLGGSSSAPSEPPSPAPAPTRTAPPPQPPPVGGAVVTPALLVTLCAKLFPSHAPKASWAVGQLQALGCTDNQIAAYFRKASRDTDLLKSNHPLLLAVWLIQKRFRSVPGLLVQSDLQRSQSGAQSQQGATPDSDENAIRRIPTVPEPDSPRGTGENAHRHRTDKNLSQAVKREGGGGHPPILLEKIERAREALRAAEIKTGLKRRLSAQDPPQDDPGGPAGNLGQRNPKPR